ncbi:energy transducer TonB [Magnetovibrio sp.]|uniref:energy transducer TonB n=1 Tax=Magnetovibrio sp. TaxID=2024836 RepID=UPI002F955746
MFRNFALSLLFHVTLVAVAYVGLPSWRDRDLYQDVPMTVEIIDVADVTNLPTKTKQPEAKKEVAKAEPKPLPPPKPPAPPPAPQGSIEEPPAPEPLPEPVEDKVAVIVNPEPKPKKEAKPKPKPEDKPAKAESKKRAPTPIPPRKPKAPDQFASVLKTLEELKSQPRPDPEEEKPKVEEKTDFASMMANALESPKQRTDIGPELTISEKDLVRQQIQRCWNLPAGAKDAHTMIISIRMVMNPDGTVQQARILEQARMSTDPFYRTMAESALRATLNPRCQPFKLPPEKFEHWKTMKLTFDPRDMLGL